MENFKEKLIAMTDKELIDCLESTQQVLENELSMDGSGELGHIIEKHFEPTFEAIYEEINKRPELVEKLEEKRFDGFDEDELPY